MIDPKVLSEVITGMHKVTEGLKMERTAEVALKILREIANEARSKDGSMALHAIANTLEQEINRLEEKLCPQ